MNQAVSDTAEYGGMTRGKRIITKQTRKEMRKILKEVQNGSFAKEWLSEYAKGQPLMNKLRRETKNHRIEKVGAKLRQMMSWVTKPTVTR
jgi:ketol-acid reductoisomerase